MSVTFWAPDAPTTKVTPYEDEPDFVVSESVLPELNMANGNASAFLKLLGLPDEYCGTIEPAAFPALRHRLLELANDPSARAPILRESCEERPFRIERDEESGVTTLRHSPRIIHCGLGDDQVQRYAEILGRLLAQAQEHNYEVCWS